MAKDNLWRLDDAFNGPAVSSSRGSQYQSGRGGENSSGLFFTEEWQRRLRSLSILLDQNAKDIESLTGEFAGLPFGGVLGNGRHGHLQISSDTTATEDIPIYQLTNLTVDSGKTWTAKQQFPGGLIISVQGTARIYGTIDCSGVGGDRGALTTGIGTSGSMKGGTVNAVGATSPAISAQIDANVFNLLWALQRNQLVGWGSGGGSGAGDGIARGGLGARGGGCFILLCDKLDLTGTITVAGDDGAAASGGNTGGGGGGGGGPIIVGYRTLVANTGTLTIAGGSGGAGAGTGGAGGSGGDGYSKVFDMRR